MKKLKTGKKHPAWMLILLALGSWSNAYSQLYFINENFSGASGSTPPSGWTQTTLSGDPAYDNWRFDNPGARSAPSPISSPFAIFDSDDYSMGGGSEDVVLTTPSFNTIGQLNVVLKWSQIFQAGYGGSVAVEVYNGSTWTTVYANSNQTVVNTETIDISQWAGNTSGVKVRFRWTGDYSYFWIIDNVQVYSHYDIEVKSLSLSGSNCGNNSDSLLVHIANSGNNAVSNFPVKAVVTGTIGGNTVNSSFNSTYTGTLQAGQNTTVSFPLMNTSAGGTLNITAYTEAALDQTRSNDTARLINYVLHGNVSAPLVSPVLKCGGGPLTINATPSSPADSIRWFLTSSSINSFASGSQATINPAWGTYTYYTAAYRGQYSYSLATTYAAGNGNDGAMFDIKSNDNISIDSLQMRLDAGNYTIRIYRKVGSYSGFQQDSNAWTSLGDYSFSHASSGIKNIAITPFVIPPYETNGIYVVMLSGPGLIEYTNGNNIQSYSSSQMTITAGNGISGFFGQIFTPRIWNGTVHYHTVGCQSPRVPVNVSVKPKPAGVSLVPGSVFQAQLNASTLANPTEVATLKEMNFVLLPPTGYTYFDYGIKWVINGLTMHTLNGTPVPSTDTAGLPPNANNGLRLRFIPSLSCTDSLYLLQVSVIDMLTGCDTLISRYIRVIPGPIPGFSSSDVCTNDTAYFINTSYIQRGTLSYTWFFGDGTSSSQENPTHVYSTAGKYPVTLIVLSGDGIESSYTDTIEVNVIPQANFSFTDGCEKAPISFTNTSVHQSGGVRFLWDLGDNSTDTQQHVQHTYQAAGAHQVTLTVEASGCSDQISKSIMLWPAVEAGFSSLSSCNTTSVGFTDTSHVASGSLSHDWNFGNGLISNLQNPVHDYQVFGLFDVQLKVTSDKGCVDSVSQAIRLSSSPSVSFGPSTACQGAWIQFDNQTDTSSGETLTYNWSWGDGNGSLLKNPVYLFNDTGSHPVKLVVTSPNGCSDSVTRVLTVYESPYISFEMDNICTGQTAIFTNLSFAENLSDLNFHWDFGNSVFSNARDTSINYTHAGTYKVILTGSLSNGCRDSFDTDIEVYPLPSALFTATTAMKGDGSWLFEGPDTGISQYRWHFGDGNSSTVQKPEHRYLTDGNYLVSLVTTNQSGCSDSTSQYINVFHSGVSGANTNNIFLYPNPNRGNFTLKIGNENPEEYQFIIYDMLGKEIGFKSSAQDTGEIQLDMSIIYPGNYLLKVWKNDGINPTIIRFSVQ